MQPNEDSDLVGFDFILENTNVNEEHLSQFEILGLLQGNLQPIDTYLEEYAYKNLDYKINSHKKADQIRKILKVQQCGIQLLNFKLKASTKKF